MTPKYIPRTYSRLWGDMVKARLGYGFGVEDIALQMKADVSSIRFHVRKMREKGELAKMWQK